MYYVLVFLVTIGKYDDALVYFQEALDASRSFLGNTHLSTLASISNMGNVFKAQGTRYSRNMKWLQSMIVFYVFCSIYW